MTDEQLKEVIRLVNLARTALGGEPIVDLPKGEPNIANSCPLANALSDWVEEVDALIEFNDSTYARLVAKAWGLDYFEDYGEEWSLTAPDLLLRFIADFDQGLLPQYDIAPSIAPNISPDPDDEEEDDEGEED